MGQAEALQEQAEAVMGQAEADVPLSCLGLSMFVSHFLIINILMLLILLHILLLAPAPPSTRRLPFRSSKACCDMSYFLVAYYKPLSSYFSPIYTINTHTSVYPYTTPLPLYSALLGAKFCHHFSALLYLIRLSSSIYASITCMHLSFLTFL
jgi:hypothetical protein